MISSSKLTLHLCVYVALTLSASCTSIPAKAPESSTITLGNQAWVKEADQDPQLMKAGDTITVNQNPILIESPGKVGVLVIPPSGTKTHTKIDLREIQNWAGDAAKIYAGNVITDILTEVNSIQALMSSGRAQEALTKVKTIQQQYPQVAHFKFLEASCLILLGDRNTARIVLQEATNAYPDNELAKKALRELTGGPRP